MKKKILIGVFVAGLFSSVAVCMAAAGKIYIPIVDKLFQESDAENELSSDDFYETVLSTQNNVAAGSDNSAVSELNNEVSEYGVEGEDDFGSQIYTMAKTTVPVSRYTSISDVSVDQDGTIYVSDTTGCKLFQLRSDGTILNTYGTDVPINGLYVSSDYVYALKGSLAGTVSVLDKGLNELAVIEAEHTPVDMVTDGTYGYVANRFSNSVSVIDLKSNQLSKTIDISGREPQAMCFANGKVYVACHLPEEGATEPVMSANVVVIRTADQTVENTLNLINGAGGVKDICASPDGRTVYVSHIIARYTYPTTQLDRGWINTNGISAIDTASNSVIASMMLDEVELGAANPWGITVSEDGKKLVCALSGTDEAMIIDIDAMNAKINNVKTGKGVVDTIDDIPNYLPFLDDCRQRVDLSGKGARAVWCASDQVYIGLYFDGSIDVLNLSDYSVSNITFVEQPEADDVRMGEIIFSDATLCYQKWQSCLSCHPDARVDGLNWDNLNDGIGNPKSAKSMMYAHRTPPTMSTGIRASAEIAVRAGMKYIQFNALEEEQMAYMDEYLKSLQPVQSPYLNRDGTLTESAHRGKIIFEEIGCASCHPAPLYTDLKTHEADTTSDTFGWEDRKMDTPSLVEVWRTGPWTFDGRFGSMKDAIARYANNQNLSDDALVDLTNFVLSIGAENESYGVEQVFATYGSTTSINSLVPGGEISYFTIRRQAADAVDAANITVTLVNKGQIKTQTQQVTNVAYNTAAKVSFESGFDIPIDLEKGATLTISISDSDGNALATDYVIQY